MTDDVAMFLFLAAGSVALFAFLSVAHWVSTHSAERMALERMALFRKLAETPVDAAAIVLAQLREDDARREHQERIKAQRNRRDSRQGGLVVLAVGIGLSIFLKAVAPEDAVWTLGIMLMLIGIVLVSFTFFRQPE